MQSTMQCPICQMDVDPQNAPSTTYNGEEYHFCSEECREKFLQDPAGHARP